MAGTTTVIMVLLTATVMADSSFGMKIEGICRNTQPTNFRILEPFKSMTYFRVTIDFYTTDADLILLHDYPNVYSSFIFLGLIEGTLRLIVKCSDQVASMFTPSTARLNDNKVHTVVFTSNATGTTYVIDGVEKYNTLTAFYCDNPVDKKDRVVNDYTQAIRTAVQTKSVTNTGCIKYIEGRIPVKFGRALSLYIPPLMVGGPVS